MPTIYRDYRPQKFNDILGQNHLKVTLQNELASDTLGQAYLFCGPRAVGKTTMARVLAQAVNCENRKTGESEPCGQCRACTSVQRGNFMDVMEIDAASNTGVDNVRDNIIASARLAPASGKMRVFIIDEVHMLSLSAFNALLKIIEEPPKHVLFVLCTTEAHKVPATIISRCQRFDFKRISPAEIVKKLIFIASKEKIEISREVLEDIARQSGGHLRDAESLFGQVLALGSKKIGPEEAELVLPRHHNQEALDLIEFLIKKDSGSAVALINQLADNGVNFKNFLEENLLLLRKIMLQSAQPGLAEKLGLDFGEQIELRISHLSSELSMPFCLRILRRFLELSQEKFISIPQLPLEMAIVELCLTKEDENSVSPTVVRDNYASSSLINKKESASESDAKNENFSAPAPDLSLAEINKLWPEVLVKIKKHNHSLSFVLQNCVPKSLHAGVMSLHFKYKFHRDRILDASIKSIMESTLAEIFRGRVIIETSLDENLELNQDVGQSLDSTDAEKEKITSVVEPEKQKNNGVLGALLESFGGEAL